MKRFFFFLLLTLCILLPAAAPFVALNNIPALPWPLTHALWIGFPPLYAFVTGLLYGIFYLKKGGGIFIAALLFAAFTCFAHVQGLPFAADTVNPALLAAYAVFALLGEAGGRFAHQRKKKAERAAFRIDSVKKGTR